MINESFPFGRHSGRSNLPSQLIDSSDFQRGVPETSLDRLHIEMEVRCLYTSADIPYLILFHQSVVVPRRL
jgi:hypothetical protein